MGTVADWKITSLGLGNKTPDIETDKCQGAKDGRHRNETEQINFFSWIKKREQNNHTGDRARSTECRKIRFTHQIR